MGSGRGQVRSTGRHKRQAEYVVRKAVQVESSVIGQAAGWMCCGSGSAIGNWQGTCAWHTYSSTQCPVVYACRRRGMPRMAASQRTAKNYILRLTGRMPWYQQQHASPRALPHDPADRRACPHLVRAHAVWKLFTAIGYRGAAAASGAVAATRPVEMLAHEPSIVARHALRVNFIAGAKCKRQKDKGSGV